MFDIEQLLIEDFKSYAGKHVFNVPTTPGLYFLTGANKQQPRLESNGAGKSTLLDAIHWCLYGRTARGLKASDVVSWGAKSATVSLQIRVAGNTYLITRTQNPNTLLLDGKTVEQHDIESLLGIRMDAFTYSVMMPQYNKSFFELSPTDKLALFSQIMGLDSWLEHSKKAAVIASAMEADVAKLSKQIGALEIATTSAWDERASLNEKEAKFDDERAAEIKRLTLKVEEITHELSGAEVELTDAKQIITEITEVIEDKLSAVDKIREAQEAYAERLNGLNKDYGIVGTKLEAAVKTHDTLNKVGGKCTVCLQKVTEKHLASERKKLVEQIGALREEFKRTEGEWHTANKFLKKAVKDRADLLTEIEGLRHEERRAATAVRGIESDINKLSIAIQAAQVAASTEAKRANPYTRLITEKEATIRDYKIRSQKLSKEVEVLNGDYESVNYWVAGFKRVRLFIIEETLRSLEIEVNNSLANLGLSGWQVEFDVERENKSGGLTKGFIVLVRAPGQPEPVRMEAWSGGESQRLQLAGDLGLANLIMQQAGLQNTIEFYDEPSKHLSKAGLLDLAETLHGRAIEDNKRIFLVDHNMPEFGDFVDVITVIKDEKGSSIQ